MKDDAVIISNIAMKVLKNNEEDTRRAIKKEKSIEITVYITDRQCE